jgi:hypothetical protein
MGGEEGDMHVKYAGILLAKDNPKMRNGVSHRRLYVVARAAPRTCIRGLGVHGRGTDRRHHRPRVAVAFPQVNGSFADEGRSRL